MHKQTITIMELGHHWNYFLTTIALFEKQFNVTLIVSKRFAKILYSQYAFEINNYRNILVEHFEYDRIYAFLEQNNVSKLFVNTVSGFEMTYAFSKFKPPIPFYVTIHNFDHWLGFRPLLNEAEFVINAEVNNVYRDCCKQIIRHCAAVATIDENIRDFVGHAIMDKKVLVFPNRVVDTKLVNAHCPNPGPNLRPNLRTDSLIRFTIPGSIDGYRRDYDPIIQAAQTLCGRYQHIQFVLLGIFCDAYGKEIIQKAMAINRTHNRQCCVLFDQSIAQKIYEQHLSDSDYFILPLKTNLNYGTLKASGAMYDAMCEGYPLLIPNGLTFSDSFRQKYGGGFIVYDSLVDTIESLLHLDPVQLSRIRQKALHNRSQFHIDRQLDRVLLELELV